LNNKNRRPKKQPERTQTDQSLIAEREKTDRELAEANAEIDGDADEVINTARRRADKVVQVARQRADEHREAHSSDTSPSGDIAWVRSQEDAAVRGERAAADVALLSEETARRAALAALLAVERQHTDLHLQTERHRSDEAVDARDEFLAVVTHDLRTLLGGVALEAAILSKSAEHGVAGDSLRQRAGTLERYVGRMSRLVDDLVDVASIEAGKLRVLVEQSDAARAFGEAVDAFMPLAAARGIGLNSEILSGSLVAKFDHDRVLQVLSNLLSNAIRFTRRGGQITLRIQPRDEFVRFSVTDTGTGIPAEQLEMIFERFTQGNRYDRSGLGLGLFISRRIIEAHGGHIWCESTVGVGSTFFFTVPAQPDDPAAGADGGG